MRFIILSLTLMFSATALAAEWQIDHDNSRLGFVATQQGGEFEGQFHDFQALMRFDPQALDQSLFDVTIDVTSTDTGSSERDAELPGKDWFHFKKFPEAYFKTTAFRALGDNRYEADGELTIKGQSHPITLAFTWTESGDRAEMDGEVVISRLRFNVGEGDWTDTSEIGEDVKVVVDLRLTR